MIHAPVWTCNQSYIVFGITPRLLHHEQTLKTMVRANIKSAHVVAFGDPFNGITLHGPFASSEDAMGWAEFNRPKHRREAPSSLPASPDGPGISLVDHGGWPATA